ncbi:MAG: glycosyltransferase family 2 protein [Alphaproteobacteria bacterium]|nr:glycosyltransferase family 2 protein [Alphaproteobacteria bacterium]
MKLSVVIPSYNEQDNIEPLMEALEAALRDINFEVVFVDDGSNDSTVDKILSYVDPRIRLIRFSRNFGQTSALAAGIAEAKGEYIATIDADLQNDPLDIPMMLEKLERENLDIVVGRRLRRQDGMILRKVPSILANGLIRFLTNVRVHDYGCTLKVFRSSVARQLGLYGELHRFIPVLSTIIGGRMAEVGVRHHPRRFGVSKYGIGRTFRVLSDLMLMWFFLKYRQKPMHLFGSLGFVLLALGSLIEGYLLVLKIMGESIAQRPLFYLGFMMILAAIQFITTGFLAELMMRSYFESQQKTPYTVAARYEGGRLLMPGTES